MDEGITVLLVDDQPIVGEAVRRLLTNESDITLHYCSRGDEAVRCATELRPTVILQDLVLPDIDGLDIVQQFRATPATASTPVVVLSTKEDPQIKSRAFAIGANDYLVKLPDRAELVARIRYHSRGYVAQLQRDEAFRALRESQEQLLASNMSLTEVNQKLNEVVGMAAHDLRNPLGVVLGLTRFLLRDPAVQDSAQQCKFLNTIQASTDFMLHLVNDLLDVSQIEAGALTLNREPTNIEAFAKANVALNRILASEKGIDVTLNAEPGLPIVLADAKRLEQVLNNLLTNAIKFSHPDTAVRVNLRAPNAEEVIISVEDHGQGIPADELHRLFMPFGVTSVRGTKGEKSTGLGLLIAKKVVDAHNGRIWVESAYGHGTTFFVALPVNGATHAPPPGALVS